MSKNIIPYNYRKDSLKFGDYKSGDIWIDPYEGVGYLICCPQCGKNLYAISKKAWKKQKEFITDDCCSTKIEPTSLGFLLHIK